MAEDDDPWGAFNMEPAPRAAPERDPWAAFNMEPAPEQRMSRRREEEPPPEPEAEGMFTTAARSFAHEAPAVVAGAAGALYGGAAGSVAGPAGTIGGALAGGFAGGYAGGAIGEEAFKAVGVDDAVQRAVNAKTNPWSAAAGQAAAQILGFGAGAASTAARVGGAAIGGALEGGQQYLQGEFDPARLATQAAAGAAFTRPYSWGTKIEQAGARAGEEIATGYRSRQAEKFVGPRQPEGPSEFQGPRQPYGPPEQYGPRQEPDLDYHGAAGPTSASGVSESPMPPPDDHAVGLREDNKPVVGEREGYAKDVRPKVDDGSSQVHVGNTDPDIQHVLDQRAAEEYGPNQPQGPQQPYGPGEFQGPRQPYGPPEQQGPRQPVAEPPQGGNVGENAGDIPPDAEMPQARSLHEHIRSLGGIKPDDKGEFAAAFGGRKNGNYLSLARKNGRSLDDIWENITKGAPEERYINDHGANTEGMQPETDYRHLLDMLADGGGKKHFPLGEAPRKSRVDLEREDFETQRHADNIADAQKEADSFIKEYGADPSFRDRMVQHMVHDGLDAEAAHDRVMDEPPEAYAKSTNVLPTYERGAEGRDQGVMPGFEQAGQGQMAQRGADAPMRAKAAQDFGGGEGLFGTGRLADKPDELFAERKVLERGRSGRPTRTEPLPIGTEEGIIKAGLEKVENTPRPEVDAPPTTEAMARKGGMSKEEMARLSAEAAGKEAIVVPASRRLQGKKLTSEDLVAGERGDIPVPGQKSAARQEYEQAQQDYRAKKIGDEEFVAARTKYEAAIEQPKAPAEAPSIETLTDTHSRGMESALDTIERAVEAGNRGEVLKAAKAARDALAQVPKEVLAADKPYWDGFEKSIKNMTKKNYETSVQQAAKEGDKDAQKILDTGVDETFKGKAVEPAVKEPVATAEPRPSAPADPINAASDKILKDMGITADEKGGERAAPIASAAEAKGVKGDFHIEPDHAKPGAWVVKKGDEVISEHANKGQAYIGLNKAAKGAPGTPAGLSPTGGQAIPPNVGAAVRQGAAGVIAPTPPAGGGPPPPPPPGGGGGGPNQPNAGHVPPQQRGWFNELWRDVQRKVGAHMLGPEAMEARRLIRGAYGEAYRVAEQTAQMLKDHLDTIRAMAPGSTDRAALINQIQGGNHFPNFTPTAEQKAFMQTHERVVQEWEAKLRSLPEADRMNFIDHYMAGMYENPNAAPNMFTGAGKRGGAGSTKGKVYATYEDAKAAGLIPKTDDPIEITTRYINSIKDFVASRQVLDRAELAGNIGYFKATQNVGATGSPTPLQKGGPPPGWKQLNGVEKNGKSGYAPEDFADAYNNFYDKGFGKTDKSRNVYEAVRNSTNAWTQLELGINAYHLFTMANEAVISDVSGALKKAFTGDFAGAGQSLKEAPLAWRNRYIQGKALQKEYLDPNSTNPIASILAEAGARPVGRGHAADYTFQDRGSFINKWDKNSIQSELNNAWKEIKGDYANSPGTGDKAMTTLRTAGRALQTVSAPIFDKYIPALKAGALQSMMKDYHAAMIKENPNFDMINNPADRKVAVNAAMKMVDSVDNRFGEMIHDNMFMNATLKQSAQVAMRSFSWAIGSMKEIGGGTLATGKNLVHLARTGENRFSMTHPEWDPRMAYAIAFPFVVSAVSTIYQGLLGSHDLPKDWRDLYAPRTGGMVPGVGGRGEVPEHVLMPGYQKDVMGWTHHPLQEAYNKLGGGPQTAIEQITGKDWRGQPIVRPNASLPEMASDRMGHLFSKLGPISVKNMTKGSEPGTEIPAWQKALGFRAPGAYIQDPEGLDRAMSFKEKRDWKTKEKRDRKTELRQSGG